MDAGRENLIIFLRKKKTLRHKITRVRKEEKNENDNYMQFPPQKGKKMKKSVPLPFLLFYSVFPRVNKKSPLQTAKKIRNFP